MSPIKVVVADGYPAFCEGLCQFLNEEPDIRVVATTADAHEVPKLATKLVPDIIIIDARLSGSNSIELVQEIKASLPKIDVIMVNSSDCQSHLVAALQSGVSGYMLRTATSNEFVSAVRLVYAGESVFDNHLISRVLGKLTWNTSSNQLVLPSLQGREREVLRLAAQGLMNRDIGKTLGITERTVQTHMVNIFRKLKVGSRTGAILRALREGWLTLDDLP